MKEVRKMKENGYTLTHSWYYDDFGLQRNSFDLFHDESRTHYPFLGDIRVNNYDKGSPYGGDDISPYTNEQYLDMLRKQVAKINISHV